MTRKRMEHQVAIIGGGMTGAAIARELSKYKLNACLIEKEPALGWGVTKGSQGLVHGGIAYLSSRIVKYHGHSNAGLTSFLRQGLNLKDRMGFAGREMFFQLAPYLDAKLIQHGRLMLGVDQGEMKRYRLMKQIAEENGIEGIEILDRAG